MRGTVEVGAIWLYVNQSLVKAIFLWKQGSLDWLLP